MENEKVSQPHDLDEQDSNLNQWCVAYYAAAEDADFNEKAALLIAAQWGTGDKITISFLDGEEEVKNRVAAVAMEWLKYANLDFEFRKDTNDTHIRISFQYPGSWSVLGTTCKNITDKTQPTMNFGWLSKTTGDDELRRVVLHEFGHALGLIHEHMSPADGGIKWNKTQVDIDLSGPPNNWSKETIFNNMFRTFSEDQLKLTRLDKDSIMMYPIPSRWTLDGFNVGLNAALSETDKAFIKGVYPGK